MVVLSVLAIMAAMLAPVFVRAQENARLACCLSHLKQIGQACMMYMSDNNEIFPVAFAYRDPYIYEDPIQVSGQAVGGCTSGIEQRDVRLPYENKRPLWKYTKQSSKLWQCPSTSKIPSYGLGDITDYEWYGNCYPMNLAFGAPPNMPTPNNSGLIYTLAGTEDFRYRWRLGRPLSTVKRPSKVIMFGERPIQQYYKAGYEDPVYAGKFRNHDKDACRTPVCYVDGHVKYVTITGDQIIRINGQQYRTYGLWDKDWALIESGWIRDRLDLGYPWGI